MVAMFHLGLGLGFLSTPYLLAVQNAVPWSRRGVATSSVQFFRSIGGAVAVAALGALLNAHLSQTLGPGTDPNVALDPDLVHALDGGLGSIYLVMTGMAILGLFVGLLFPKGSAQSHAHQEAG
jgi:MFS family permease